MRRCVSVLYLRGFTLTGWTGAAGMKRPGEEVWLIKPKIRLNVEFPDVFLYVSQANTASSINNNLRQTFSLVFRKGETLNKAYRCVKCIGEKSM